MDELVSKRYLLESNESLFKKIQSLFENKGGNGKAEKDWLTTAEVMERFGIRSANTLQNLKSKGLRCCKLGGKNLYNYKDLVSFIQHGK